MGADNGHRARATGALRGEHTTLRRATAEDADLLVEWHADPEVARFWDWETYTRAEIEERLARTDVRSFIIEESGAGVGFIQAWTDDRWITAGLDMFLIPRARGRGGGPDAARVLARHLRDEYRCACVTTDPYVWNEPAIGAWARAGFVPHGERPPDAEHTAPWLLMVFTDD